MAVDTTSRRDPDLLDGWKAIADYLGKSIRTAQRWRSEFGLPVHRLGGQEGEGVYAFRSEIDEWRRTRRQRGAVNGGDPPDASGENGSHITPRPGSAGLEIAPARPWRRWAWVALALAVVAVSAWVGWREWRRSASYWTVRDGVLIVFDAERRVLWEKTFERPLLDAVYFGLPDPLRLGGPVEGTGPSGSRAARAELADLDGDRRREILIVPHYADAPVQEHLVCYDSRGRETWRYAPSDTAVFGTERLGAPNLAGVAVRHRSDSTPVLFVVSQHLAEFSSLVARLAPDGRVIGRYWSAGHIVGIEILHLGGRDWVLLGAAHNESLGASLAVFDLERFGGSAPADVDKYRCNGCPPGRPDYFFVFPRTPVSDVGGYPTVTSIYKGQRDSFHIDAQHAWRELPGQVGHHPAKVVYRFDALFRIRDADFSSIYYGVEALLVQEGRLRAATARQDKSTLWPVRRWHAGAWETIAGPER